jgi:hypothetical protein
MQKKAIEKDNAKTSGLDKVEAIQSEVGKIKPNQNYKHVSPSKKSHIQGVGEFCVHLNWLFNILPFWVSTIVVLHDSTVGLKT